MMELHIYCSLSIGVVDMTLRLVLGIVALWCYKTLRSQDTNTPVRYTRILIDLSTIAAPHIANLDSDTLVFHK
jgi:hypothetical protein